MDFREELAEAIGELERMIEEQDKLAVREGELIYRALIEFDSSGEEILLAVYDTCTLQVGKHCDAEDSGLDWPVYMQSIDRYSEGEGPEEQLQVYRELDVYTVKEIDMRRFEKVI